MGFDIILEIIELRPLAVAIAHAILLDSDFLEQGRRLLAGWRAEYPVMVTEMNDIAFLTVRRWQAIAPLVEDAISDGVFLSHERRGFLSQCLLALPMIALLEISRLIIRYGLHR